MGDLFGPVEDEKFDLILFNTPYLPTDEDEMVNDELEAAWDGGKDGRSVIDRFIKDLSTHLNPRGHVQLVQSSLSNVEETIGKLMEMNFEVTVTASERFFFEEVVVLTGVLSKLSQWVLTMWITWGCLINQNMEKNKNK